MLVLCGIFALMPMMKLVELNAYGDGEYVVVSILFDKPEHEQEWQGSSQDDDDDDSDLDDSDLDDGQPGGFADQGVRDDDDTDLEDEGPQSWVCSSR
jgi:hypothetical protein